MINLNSEKIWVGARETCKSIKLEAGNGITLHWSKTPVGEVRPSSPMCVDKNDNILQRRCIEVGFWEEFQPDKCTFFSLKKFSFCPYGMEKVIIKNEELCLKVTKPKKWENSCLKYGDTESIDKFKNVVNYLKTVKNLTEFWMPIKRFQDYNPFQLRIAGAKWGKAVDFDDYELRVDDNYIDDCLKMDISGAIPKFKSENCEKEIPEVCIYDENSVMKLACKNGLTSRYSFHQNKCFYIVKNGKNPRKNLFQATAFYSRAFITDLLDSFNLNEKDRCLVDLGTVDYTQNFFINLSYGNFTLMNKEGKWTVGESYTCAIYEETIDLQVPEIHLKFDSSSGRMQMVIYSEEFLWKNDENDPGVRCFTIADNELIKFAKVSGRLWSGTIKGFDVKLFDGTKTRREVSKSIYELKMYGSGPGIYWCEGHAINSFQLVKSKKIFARRKLDGFVFAVTMEAAISVNNDEIYEDDVLDTVTKRLKKVLEESGKINDVDDIRVMKILNYNKGISRMTAIFHVTILDKSQSGSSDEEYDFNMKYADKIHSDRSVTNHDVMNKLEIILRNVNERNFKFVSIRSTEYCLPASIKNPNSLTNTLYWEKAFIGETLPPTELCLYKSGIPLTRKCDGDFLNGGHWQKLSPQELQCIDKEKLSLHTKRLFSFNKVINPNETHGIIENMTSISAHYDQLIPADLFYISKSFQQITSVNNVTNSANLNSVDLDDKYNLTIILNNIMNVNDSFIQLSQLKLNTTNILLDSFDNLINSLSTNYSIYAPTINNNLISNSLNKTDGTFIMRTEKIVVFICDPRRLNVSGMALVKRVKSMGDESSLMDYDVEKLYATQTIDDILNIYQDSLEIASFFPEELLNRIDEIKKLEMNATGQVLEPLKIVVKVYYNDAIFKESAPVTSYKSQSKIISVSIPGHDQNLPLLLPIMFKKSQASRQSTNDVCGYWEFQPSGASSDSSEWLQEGCDFLGVSKYDENLALCGCSHMTHFAYLIMGTYTHDIKTDNDVIITKFNTHSRVLNVITLLGSGLSVLGIIGIFITASCFRVWRQKPSTKVLLQLSLAIALQMILFSFFSTEQHTYTIDTDIEKKTCVVLGASLHYSVLVTFSWMLIAAFLQFKRYVTVLGNLKPDRFFLKSFLVGWGAPFIPIAIVLIIDPYLYIPEIYGICYPQGLAFYFSVLLPVGLIVVANLVVFIIVLFNILKSGWNQPGESRKTEHNMTLSQLRVSIFLFFLLGLTWIFGLLASSKATIIFSYLFCLTATIQGFVLFLYFILMDPITRKLWRESFRSWKPRN
jgi:7 transmembrane receptor (Secretin family)/GPCR proteolysis site, GPS, motif